MHERERRNPAGERDPERPSPAPRPIRRQVVPAVRRALVVGAADDAAEHEADRMADAALARLGGLGDTARRHPAPSRIRRRGGDDAAPDDAAPVVGAEGGAVDHDTDQRIRSAQGGGHPLPGELAGPLGEALGADLSAVRLHQGAESAELNARLGAQAFTVGNDVFLGGGAPAPGTSDGDHLLAHELAHVVQNSGGARRTIRRATAMQIVNQVRGKLDTSRGISGPALLDPAKFKEATNTRGHGRGDALVAIDQYLLQYKQTSPTDYPALVKLFAQMEYAAEQWILAHSVQDVAGATTERSGADAATGDWLIDPDRKKRFAGMALFLEFVGQQIATFKRLAADTTTSAETLAAVEAAGEASEQHKKLKAKYEGDPTSSLTGLGQLIEMAVPNAGDASEIEAAFRWPVEPSGVAFVGGTIRLKAENSSPPGSSTGGQSAKNILARMEVVFTVGAQGLNLGKIQAEIGGFIESSAKTGKECMTLMSYLLFRKFRESSVMPREVTNYLWGGGNAGKFGALKAENWSKSVETGIIADNENAYVQSGVIGGVSGDVSLGSESIGGGLSGAVRGGSGTRYDKDSIESVKGAVGANNERRSATSFAATQKELGRGIRFFTIDVGGEIGPFSGDVAVKLQWQTAKGLGASGPNEYTLAAAEIEFSAGASVPNVGGDELGERIAGWATEGVKTLVSKVRAAVGAQQDKANAALTKGEKDDAKKASIKGEAWATLFDGLDQLRNVNAVETLANPNPIDSNWLGGTTDQIDPGLQSQIAGSDGFKQAFGQRSMDSTIGMQIVLGGDLIGKEFQLSINFEKAREFSIPMFLDVSQTSTSRLIAFRKDASGWKIL